LGVVLHTSPEEQKPTGTCVVLVTPDAERTMNTHLGASAEFDAMHVDEELLAQSEWLYVEGYLFSSEKGRSAARTAARLAKQHGVKIAVTFSDVFIVEAFGDALAEVVEDSDLIFANVNEARRFIGEEDEERVFSALKKRTRNAIMTRTEKGAWVYFNQEEVRADAFKVDAVDETGAGDMFAGYWSVSRPNQANRALPAR